MAKLQDRAGIRGRGSRKPIFVKRSGGISPKTKDPSGGTTGRVKPRAAGAWMGARAEYSLDGEG